MLLTKQQKYLLAVLDKLGCAEQRQLAALLQKAFAFSSLDGPLGKPRYRLRCADG